MRNLLFVAFIAAALVGCSSTPTTEAPVEDHGTSGATAPGAGGAETGGAQGGNVSGSQLGGADELHNPSSILSKRSVYFDFDSFVVKDEYRPLVEAHAKFLRDNPTAKMLIQGNADERGSREYNVGLGQRRSDSLKKMLTLLGARESQVESVSLGEEKPVCNEHDEECWAKNRRDDMLYNGEY
jgi:peptidoglycan-associated lipoprotein